MLLGTDQPQMPLRDLILRFSDDQKHVSRVDMVKLLDEIRSDIQAGFYLTAQRRCAMAMGQLQ